MLAQEAVDADPRFLAYVHAWADCCDGYIRPGDVVWRRFGVVVHAACEPINKEDC